MKMSLLTDTDDYIRRIIIPKASDMTFTVEGVPFYAHTAPEGDTAQFTLWCTLGYLPYSVSSVENRHAMIMILESTRSLKTVKFGVDQHMKMVAKGEYTVPAPLTPVFPFPPIIEFMREARPFIKLIAEHL